MIPGDGRRRDTRVAIGMAGVARGKEQLAAVDAVAAVETAVLAGLVRRRGQGQWRRNGSLGDPCEIRLQAEQLLGRKLLRVAHEMLDAEYSCMGDIAVAIRIFLVLTPPGLA